MLFHCTFKKWDELQRRGVVGLCSAARDISDFHRQFSYCTRNIRPSSLELLTRVDGVCLHRETAVQDGPGRIASRGCHNVQGHTDRRAHRKWNIRAVRR